MNKILESFVKWRTWIVNGLFAAAIVIPDLLVALLGFNWDTIIPIEYMPYVTLVILILNVWMRPRAAVLPNSLEAKITRITG